MLCVQSKCDGGKMVTEFIIIRHGESVANLSKIYAGHTDFELSDKGRTQAKSAADYFKDESISAIYSSDLKRAYGTALPHAELHSLPVIPTQDLREVNIGEWEGVPLDEVKLRWPYEFDYEWKQLYGSMTPPGGEPVYDAGKRMYTKLIEIANKEDGKVLIVSHGGVIRALWCYAQDVEPSEWASFVPFPSNASASIMKFDGEKLIPVKYSFDDYIAEKTYVVS